ncbi:hypothetical protein C7974DRAFT_405455 [Boeremia exigua]|uniref:uncharacterized protein n=1 Tax=Boeremia exigua TaxID=749465 RepID=UPI001E8E731E|nr:uncharacterized protein C7974DRAFT_405455 [Boeremia exigua]KAH6612378.1 hypothetical protein C7974DRAFT_405455 [Boeremia exigua]
MFECYCCTRTFRTRQSRDQHMDDTDHWNESYECDGCTREFSSQHAKEQHMTAVGHWNDNFECNGCTREFSSQRAKEQHMTAVGHWSRHYQTMGTAAIQPLQTSTTETGDNVRDNQTNEEGSKLNVLGPSGTNTLSRYRRKLTSCISKYVYSCSDVPS